MAEFQVNEELTYIPSKQTSHVQKREEKRMSVAQGRDSCCTY